MTTFFACFIAILVFDILFDVVFKERSSRVIEVTTEPKTELELLIDKVDEIMEDLEELEDDLSEAIEDGDDNVEARIREKIKNKKEVLKVYLTKLEKLNEKIS